MLGPRAFLFLRRCCFIHDSWLLHSILILYDLNACERFFCLRACMRACVYTTHKFIANYVSECQWHCVLIDMVCVCVWVSPLLVGNHAIRAIVKQLSTRNQLKCIKIEKLTGNNWGCCAFAHDVAAVFHRCCCGCRRTAASKIATKRAAHFHRFEFQLDEFFGRSDPECSRQLKALLYFNLTKAI